MGYQRELATIVAATAKAQNIDFLASDFQLKWAGSLVRLTIAITTAVKVNLVPSSGAAIALNGSSALSAGGVHTFELALDQGRTWNLQTDNAAGTTVNFLCIAEVSA